MAVPIVARGVRVHNLKGIDVTIPTGELVVVTGVSGSGKSSLAFDVLYAEGRRRYVESLSASARHFLDRMEKPELDEILGLCPVVALRQRPFARSPRSTVGTVTEVHDHLRALYAAEGVTVCDGCGERVRRDTVASVVDHLFTLPDETRLLVAFAAAGGAGPEELQSRLRERGFSRFLVGQEVKAGIEEGCADPTVLVDRVVVGRDSRARVAEALQMAFREGSGDAIVQVVDGERLHYCDRFECASCRRPFPEPEPRLFSFNHPLGACPTCHGSGRLVEPDLTRIVPDPTRSLRDGAVEPWTRARHRPWRAGLRALSRRHALPMGAPWSALAPEQQRLVIDGDLDFPGVRGFFRQLVSKRHQGEVRAALRRYRTYEACPTCEGRRLRPEALRVKVGGRSLDEVCAMSIRDAARFLGELNVDPPGAAVGWVVEAVRGKLTLLLDLGLEYLSLDRSTGSLSGGEAQRIDLVSALSAGLVGTLYVLDEPSVGLHPRDTARLVRVLGRLRDQGNTVLVVEHDLEILRAADHVIDLGPGAGEQGGRVIFAGSYSELLEDQRGLTGKFARGEMRVTRRRLARRLGGPWLGIRGARARNLKGIDVKIPLEALTVVTGVSGSGKSTLVHDVLGASLRRSAFRPLPGRVEGADLVEGVEVVDQTPLGRTPRSNPVTYLKAFDPIRDLFASTPGAKARALSAGDFSFNVRGGRCEACEGDGRVRVDMHFLADVFLVCDACDGHRYRPKVLEVEFRGKSIDEVLALTVRDALRHFAGHPKVTERLKALDQIGLGYLRLGQSATTLSGGEAQRVKLAAHLHRRVGRRSLYILDEPTTGLHPSDVRDLLDCMQRLVEKGATLVVVEHNLDLLDQADWVIDLGPEGGAGGGHLVFQGTPEALAAQGSGATAESFRAAERARSERAAS